MDQQIIDDINQWLDEVVIGLNLCPFAAKPRREKRVRIAISHATDEEALLNDLQAELERLSDTPVEELETTLLAIPDMLENFEDYNDFLDAVDLWVEQFGWEGELQVASFHPQYQFADTEADEPGNLTNRSPWPMLHIIREESLEQAVDHYPDVEGIPERNIKRMEALSKDEKRKLFPYLFG
ncbi:hypothetical protein CGK74_09845 [Thauera propionica]|jgi:hypothetical protein|uniref:DUF1415 domain-containing protein n=1 Tax=Thauera propionica TaxID=2019431 RepID=A0A235EXY4_9RHOO|nr:MULTISPECIES: DUF1415 domain-containing protein [Thauera]MDD3676101.1 DUF1415 domain-containing protein [Thauera propionica]MDI3489518.1 uncharacterized protein [Thauera sp.]OYD53874.1 hypothetical protein CGK74_09845 [Thauera propionica]